MIKQILGILALQIAFGIIVGVAILMGQTADARCKPVLQKPVNPWAPTRKCSSDGSVKMPHVFDSRRRSDLVSE